MINFFKNNAVVVLGLNILFFMMYLILSTCRLSSLDDFFMSSVLTGAYGSEYDVHLYFINAIYGYFLKPFYLLFPKVGWYYVFELLEVFVSFSVFCYLLVDRLGKKFGLVLSLLLLSCVAPDFYYQVNFTQCAEVLTAAGMLLIFLGDWDSHKRRLFLGSVLFVAGFVMRRDAFLMGLPYVFILLGANVFIQRKIPWSKVLVLMISALGIVGLFVFDRNLYSEGEYKYYADFQGPRAALVDGAYYQREAVLAELNERGEHGDVFRASGDWLFYDTEAFDLDSLRPVFDAISNNLYTLDIPRTAIRTLGEFSMALFTTNAWCWVVFCLLVFLSNPRYGGWLPWVSLGVIVMCFLYLLMVNRVLYHVQVGVWLYATTCMIPYIQKDFFERHVVSNKILLFVVLVGMLGYAFAYSSQPDRLTKNKESSEQYKAWQDFKKYAKNHKSDVFMLSFHRYKEFATATQGNSFTSIIPGDFDNIFPLGYWNVHLPGMKRELEKYDIKNPVKAIVNPNVYLLESPMNFALGPRSFYEWHYGRRLQVDSICVFGSYKLVQYRLGEAE